MLLRMTLLIRNDSVGLFLSDILTKTNFLSFLTSDLWEVSPFDLPDHRMDTNDAIGHIFYILAHTPFIFSVAVVYTMVAFGHRLCM